MEFFECTWPPWQVALFVIGGHRLAPRRRNFVFFFGEFLFLIFLEIYDFFFHPLMVAEKENSQGMVLAYFTEFYRVRLLFLVVVVVSSTILKSQLHGD